MKGRGIQVLVALGVLCVCSSSLEAQERTRVFLRFQGDAAAQVEALSLLFEGTVLSEGVVEFAGTAEMDQVYAECREQIGVAASEERSCRLQAARRLFVEELLEISATPTKDGRVRVGLAVWNTSDNAKIYGALVTVEAQTLEHGLESGLPDLASRYLCFRGVERHCNKPADASNQSDEQTDDPVEATPIQPPPQTQPLAGGVPDLVTEEPLSAEARRVTFLPHAEKGHWSLHAMNNRSICALPCTRWVAPRSGAYIAGVDSNGDAMTRIDVPNELGYGPEQPLKATPELDSDWQDWEVNSLIIGGSGFVVSMVGMGVLFGGLFADGEATAEIAIGGTLFGLGSIAFSMVAPIYAGYNWIKSDGRDHLIFEEVRDARPVESSSAIGIRWSFF